MSTLRGTANFMVDQFDEVALEVGAQGILGVHARVEENLTDQVRSTSEITKTIALGDLDKFVNVDFRGDLSALANKVTRLEVGTEGILGGSALVIL
ncbi:hypothetical protein BYT27DRAFT_7184762 [Phlegmacium glaucopus]|nr:hypothetical protein BYT27DRAFT_7184762 [Phlegmacium glaucopus]